MKKVMGIVLAVFLVLGAAGQAMAAFELGNVKLVAYEETDMALPISTVGNEVHTDLGATMDSFIDGSIAPISVDTGISLDEYGATSWTQIYVGIFGGGKTPSFQSDDIVFASATDTFSVTNASAFGSASGSLWQGENYGTAFPTNGEGNKAGLKSASNSYWDTMDVDGTSPSYGSFLGGFTGFGPEAQLMDGVVEMQMYTTDPNGVNPTNLGTWSLDTTGGTLVASYSAVPVPGAVLLFGTGLLGFFGIRRKK